MSDIWKIDLFTKLDRSKVKCKVCKKESAMPNSSIKGLKYHINVKKNISPNYKTLDLRKHILLKIFAQYQLQVYYFFNLET